MSKFTVDITFTVLLLYNGISWAHLTGEVSVPNSLKSIFSHTPSLFTIITFLRVRTLQSCQTVLALVIWRAGTKLRSLVFLLNFPVCLLLREKSLHCIVFQSFGSRKFPEYKENQKLYLLARTTGPQNCMK